VQELKEAWKLQDEATLLGEDATRRALQVLPLDKRRPAQEDGYCRHMTSFGLELVQRLTPMTPDEQCRYTLVEFSRFSLTEIPHASFPPRVCACDNPAWCDCD